MLSDNIRINGHKLKHRRFPQNIRKHFLIMRVSKCWHRQPKKVLKSPSLEIFKSCTSDWFWVALLEWGGGVGQDDLQKSNLNHSMSL